MGVVKLARWSSQQTNGPKGEREESSIQTGVFDARGSIRSLQRSPVQQGAGALEIGMGLIKIIRRKSFGAS